MIENYKKNKKDKSIAYGKLTNLSPSSAAPPHSTRAANISSETPAITDEEGLKRAYNTNNGLYQHNNKLCIAGAKDFPQDHIDDLKLPFDDTLVKTKRGRDADAYI